MYARLTTCIVVVVLQNPRARKIRDNFGADSPDTTQPASPGSGSPASPNRLVALRKAVLQVQQ